MNFFKAFRQTLILYPGDFYELLECISVIGARNDAHVRYYFEEITGNNNYFDNSEPLVDDKNHVLEFILLINSLKTVNDSGIKLPLYFTKHISYFACAYRKYMPDTFCTSSLTNKDQNYENSFENAAKKLKYAKVPYLKYNPAFFEYYLKIKNLAKSSKIK